ncbi:hypothetical protein AC578_4352 [Pseudocercospora eumusae]|uniref:Uncharacterized protein n=1 Tax=Pseudocercospora eumusae TaxID=321146 RepID=A0A139H5T8_9PEZI|nr:hypothetical protein AC578_4352 [Pseudocercospora eumusae]
MRPPASYTQLSDIMADTTAAAAPSAVLKPADHLNILLQRLNSPSPAFQTIEHRTYAVEMRLPPELLQLVATPKYAAMKRLLEKACSGARASTPVQSKQRTTAKVCEILEMLCEALGVPEHGDGKRKKKKKKAPASGTPMLQPHEVKQEPGIQAMEGLESSTIDATSTSRKRKRSDANDAMQAIIISDDDDQNKKNTTTTGGGSLFVSESEPARYERLESPSSDSEHQAYGRRHGGKRARLGVVHAGMMGSTP